MKHTVTETEILVPIREVMNRFIDVVDDVYPTVYLCEVFKAAFKRHKIARGSLGSGDNTIIQQMCYMLGATMTEEDLEDLDWSWGIEDAFDGATLTEFYREGNRIVYGPEYAHGSYDNRWVYPRDQILVRIGMMSRMIENFGEDAVFSIPLKVD